MSRRRTYYAAALLSIFAVLRQLIQHVNGSECYRTESFAQPLHIRASRIVAAGNLAGRHVVERKVHVRRRIAAGHADNGVRVRLDVKYNCDDGGKFAVGDFNKPLEFVVGSGTVVSGLEDGVKGMQIGETRLLSFDSMNPLFGIRDANRLISVPTSELPDGAEVGAQIVMNGEGVLLLSMNDTAAVLDLNHPLAGRGLTVATTLLSCEKVVSASEVQREIISAGDGKTFPTVGDNVVMHYVGSIAATGEVFDSSRDRGEPFSFRIGIESQILGWDEGIMEMSVGERATLRVPAEKAYGDRGNDNGVPSNADLIFDVELLSVYSDFVLAD